MTSSDNALTQRIEQWLAERLPAVELLACQRVAAERLRLTIDHPDGVDLGLCERVTKELAQLREQYAIEVSSPGPERPLTKPDHFRRFIGRRARVRTRLARAGHRSFTGELVGASDAEVTVAADIGVVSIPYTEIAASNLISRAEASARAGQRGKT
ncbi:MAG: ribosome maturation factor RimP [Thermoleophilaceae bacterium]